MYRYLLKNSITDSTICKKVLLARISQRFSSYSALELDFRDFLKKLPPECHVGDVHFTKKNENIGVVSIDNYKSLNAMTGKMMMQLGEVTRYLSNWKDGKAVILMGSNGQFCSGGDLKNFMNFLATPELGYLMSCYMHEVMKEFKMLPMPTLALIQGHTLGGGVEITTACDYRVMCKQSAIGFVQSRLGITPGFGGATRLTKIVGKRNAMELLISGRKLTAQEALMMGFVDDTFPPEDNAIKWSIDWLEQRGLLRCSPSLTQGITAMIKKCDYNYDTESCYSNERQLFKAVWQGEEHKRAINKQIKHK